MHVYCSHMGAWHSEREALVSTDHRRTIDSHGFARVCSLLESCVEEDSGAFLPASAVSPPSAQHKVFCKPLVCTCS